MSQIHSLNVPRLTTSILFQKRYKERKKRYFKSLKSSLVRIETLLFFIAKHLRHAGAVADAAEMNAASVPKAQTECHFFVKFVVDS